MLPEEKQLEKQQEEQKTPPGICRDPAALRGLRPRPRALKYGMLRDGMGWEGMRLPPVFVQCSEELQSLGWSLRAGPGM